MATLYKLSLGYQPVRSEDEAGPMFLAIVHGVANDSVSLVEEALKHYEWETTDMVRSCAEAYRLEDGQLRTKDATLVLDLNTFEVFSHYSGGSEEKRLVRRAFCRRVIEECHLNHIEVNLTVS